MKHYILEINKIPLLLVLIFPMIFVSGKLFSMTPKEAVNIINGLAIEIIGLTLLLANEDSLNREYLFSRLQNQYGGNGYIGMSILSAQRTFSNLDVQKVMPFLEFLLRSLSKRATSNELNELKVQLSTFKNSLTIMNHFGNLKNTLAFQAKGELTLFQPVES